MHFSFCLRQASRSLSLAPPSLRFLSFSVTKSKLNKTLLEQTRQSSIRSHCPSGLSVPAPGIFNPADMRSLLPSFKALSLFSEIPRKNGVFSGDPWNVAKNVWRFSGTLEMKLGNLNTKENVSLPYATIFRRLIHSESPKHFERRNNFRPMNFVKGIIEESGKDIRGSSQFTQHVTETNADIVHIKMLRNNTFINVTDSKGNTKAWASSGHLKELQGGGKVSRYAAEATAEFVGRRTRELGVKSVVMKVNGFTHFKRKRLAILSWKDGYSNSRSDQNPIVYIEDTTRRPHNGCRLRKKRRI
ncbi:small ribosomal subunit protein uS11m [Malania oleifera]|uniref:small ribosomal subunit protein uS11m n=1 Tax=Malania oleifera TaxID=397392 RepID=UPI0025AE3D1C|nr:small ribosomal subunit protein uS11m [Malania oleifera]